MTMHLARGLTTLNTRKKKPSKMTAGKLERLQKEHKDHNKHMRRIGCHGNVMSFSDYVDYVQGNYKPKNRNTTEKSYQPIDENYRRASNNIPSRISKDSFAPATKKEAMQYTGERKLVGIAMMHKSNLVPVFADDDDKTGQKQATEIAQMRRN